MTQEPNTLVPGSTPNRIAKILHFAGLDFHVLLTLVFRVWNVLAGAVMLLLLPLCLNPQQLGYHYTFASLLALQVFFELGMNQVVTQMTSHELAHLKSMPDGSLVGDAYRIDRLTALTRLLRRWYFVASSLFLIITSIAGLIFFSRDVATNQVTWLGPWLLLCIATAGNLYLSPTLAMLEGAGRIGEVARIRLLQSMLGYSLMAVVLACGAGLWASTVVSLSACVMSALWIRRSARMVQWLRWRLPETIARVDWRREIFPFQWRIALSWISGYFIFQLFTPMIFTNQGAAEAGRFGMVLAIFNAIQSIGMSWIYSCSPQMAASISRNNGKELRAIFMRAVKSSVGFTTLACIFAVLIVWACGKAGFDQVHRLSSMTVIVCIALVTITNSLIFAFAVFMRSHKEEPMMMPSVTLAIASLAIAHWASHNSVELTALLYLAVTALVSLPWSYSLFQRYWVRG